MPDVTGAILPDELRLEFLAETARDRLRDRGDRRRPARTDVERASVCAVFRERKCAAARDVAHVDEVPCLPAVLEDERGAVVEQRGGEDRGGAGVGVREGLRLAVEVEEGKGDGGQPEGAAARWEHLPVVALVDG